LRVGTEVIIALPPERVMSALAPLDVPAPSIQPPQGELPIVPFDERPGGQRKRQAFS